MRTWLRPGDAPRIVLVHGLGVAGRMHVPLAQHLARRFHVDVPDLPGFGESDKPRHTLTVNEHADVLAEWLTERGPRPAAVAGVSLGSQVALALAHRHPGLADLLVLGSPIVDPARRRWRSQVPRWLLEQQTQSLRMRAIQLDDVRKCGVRRVVRTFADALQDRPEDRLPHVACPVLTVWGPRDPLVSRRWAERTTQLAPHGRLAVIPGGVHAMSHEHPLELARTIGHHVDRWVLSPST